MATHAVGSVPGGVSAASSRDAGWLGPVPGAADDNDTGRGVAAETKATRGARGWAQSATTPHCPAHGATHWPDPVQTAPAAQVTDGPSTHRPPSQRSSPLQSSPSAHSRSATQAGAAGLGASSHAPTKMKHATRAAERDRAARPRKAELDLVKRPRKAELDLVKRPRKAELDLVKRPRKENSSMAISLRYR